MLLDKYKKELVQVEKQIESNKAAGITNLNKLKTKRKLLRTSIENLERNIEEVNKLKPHTYYSVKIMLSPCNMEHTSIMYVGYNLEEYPVNIFNRSYVEDMFIHNIYSFKVLRELDEMK